jgi:hypothetical protein
MTGVTSFRVAPIVCLTSGCSRRLRRYSLDEHPAPRLSRGRQADTIAQIHTTGQE